MNSELRYSNLIPILVTNWIWHFDSVE